MAIVKFVPAGSPLNNIFDYVMRDEATEDNLISGINCCPESALEEFRFVKRRFHKEDGRSYYHIVQSFSPVKRTAGVTTISCSRSHPMTTSLPRPLTRSD